MPQIGHFTRLQSGYSGHVRTLMLDVELAFVPIDNAGTDNAPDYRIHLDDDEGPEVGAGWKRNGSRVGPYVSVLLDDPGFVQPIRARLFQADDEGRTWSLHWMRQKKRREED